jgi:hypothetical protein
MSLSGKMCFFCVFKAGALSTVKVDCLLVSIITTPRSLYLISYSLDFYCYVVLTCHFIPFNNSLVLLLSKAKSRMKNCCFSISRLSSHFHARSVYITLDVLTFALIAFYYFFILE